MDSEKGPSRRANVFWSYVFVIVVYVVLMPVVSVVIGRLLDGLLDFPSILVSPPWNLLSGGLLIAFGWFWIVWSQVSIVRIGKGHPAEVFQKELSPVTQRLIIRGPYRYTRNPMCFGNLTYIYLGLGLCFQSLSMVLFYPVAIPLAFLYFRIFEEPALEERFGEEFRRYRKRVPWFFPRLRGERDL